MTNGTLVQEIFQFQIEFEFKLKNKSRSSRGQGLLDFLGATRLKMGYLNQPQPNILL